MTQAQVSFTVDTNLQFHESELLSADTKLALCTVDVSEDTLSNHDHLDHDDHVKHITRHVTKYLMGLIERKELLTVLQPDGPGEGFDEELDKATLSEIPPIQINTTTVCYYLARDLPYAKPRNFTTHVLVNLYTCLGPPPDEHQSYQRVYFGKRERGIPKSSWNHININENPNLSRQPRQGAYTPGSREMTAHVIPVACKVTIEQTTPKGLVEKKDTAVNEIARPQARNILQVLQPKLLGHLATDSYIQVDKSEYPQHGFSIGHGLELRSGFEHDLKIIGTESDIQSRVQFGNPTEIAVASDQSFQLFYEGNIGLHVFMNEYSKLYPVKRLSGRCSDLDFEELDAVVRNLKVCYKPDEAQYSAWVVRGLPSEHALKAMKSKPGSGDFYVRLKRLEGLVLASTCTISANQPFQQHKPHRLVSERKQEAEELFPRPSASLYFPRARGYMSYTSKPQYTDRINLRQAQHFQDSIRLIFVEIDFTVPSPEWRPLVTALKHKVEDWGVGGSDRLHVELSSEGSIEEYQREWTAALQTRAKNGNTKRPIFIFATKEKRNRAMYNLVKRIFDVDLGYQSHMVSLPELRRDSRKDNDIVAYAGRLFSKILARQPPMTSCTSKLPVAIGLNICSVAQSRTEKDDSQMYLVSIVSRTMRYSESYRTSVTVQRASSFKELNVGDLIQTHIPSGVSRVMIYRYGEYFDDEAPDTIQTPETNQPRRTNGNFQTQNKRTDGIRHINPTELVSSLNPVSGINYNSDRNGPNGSHTGNNSQQMSPTLSNGSSGLGANTPNFHSCAAAANQELQYLKARLQDSFGNLELRYILLRMIRPRYPIPRDYPRSTTKPTKTSSTPSAPRTSTSATTQSPYIAGSKATRTNSPSLA